MWKPAGGLSRGRPEMSAQGRSRAAELKACSGTACRFQISDLGRGIGRFRVPEQISDFRFQTSRSSSSNVGLVSRFQISDFRADHSIFRMRGSDFRFQISGLHRSSSMAPISEFCSQNLDLLAGSRSAKGPSDFRFRPTRSRIVT